MTRGEQLLISIAVLILLAGSYVDLSEFRMQGTSSTSGPATSTGIIASTTTTMITTTTVDGTTYYADNVTDMMVTSLSFHFKNGSVIFRGVDFRTICTTYAGGCPGVPTPPASVTVVYPSGPGITVNVTFADRSEEAIGGGFPIVPVYFHAFTLHRNPQAGILIVCTDSSPNCKSYLLVSTGSTATTNSNTSGGAGIFSNTAVATVTVTTTLTTQASQAATTYAIPTTNCTLLGGEIVTPTTTTITVGAASTTTVTVTATSTSYTQTVTLTSCTYSRSTVTSTSTATTTANP